MQGALIAQRSPLTSPVDILLADVAIGIQLSRTDYDKAVQRYGTINEWIERADSPVRDRVEIIYPQGSMATKSTIASRLRTDEFDIDLVAQLDLPMDITPGDALNLLYTAIRGEPGSRYYRMTKPANSLRHHRLQRRHAPRRHADAATVGDTRARERALPSPSGGAVRTRLSMHRQPVQIRGVVQPEHTARRGLRRRLRATITGPRIHDRNRQGGYRTGSRTNAAVPKIQGADRASTPEALAQRSVRRSFYTSPTVDHDLEVGS